MPFRNLTNSFDAEVKAELRSQLLVGFQSAQEINDLHIFWGEKYNYCCAVCMGVFSSASGPI